MLHYKQTRKAFQGPPENKILSHKSPSPPRYESDRPGTDKNLAKSLSKHRQLNNLNYRKKAFLSRFLLDYRHPNGLPDVSASPAKHCLLRQIAFKPAAQLKSKDYSSPLQCIPQFIRRHSEDLSREDCTHGDSPSTVSRSLDDSDFEYCPAKGPAVDFEFRAWNFGFEPVGCVPIYIGTDAVTQKACRVRYFAPVL